MQVRTCPDEYTFAIHETIGSVRTYFWVELESGWKTGLSLKVFKVRSMRFAINSLWFEDFFKPLAASSITTRPKKFKKCDLSYLEHDHYGYESEKNDGD